MTGRPGACPVVVLISGSGTNLQALIDDAETGSGYRIVGVISNRPGVKGLQRAADAGIPTRVIDHKGFADRNGFDEALAKAVDALHPGLVVLAGFMRILTDDFVDHFSGRMVNIHPSLLPAFPGLDTHARALAAGCQVHGCTVHLVRPTLDDGPILVQGVVPVLADDDAPTLAARVLEVEHRCYPIALDLVARGGMTIDGNRVMVPGGVPRLVGHELFRADAPPYAGKCS